VRQVIRDIKEIDPCMHDEPQIEVRILLGIDKRGLPTLVSVKRPLSPRAATCIVDALWGWEFASARQAGELLVVYQPGR
jgi:hypothetical protein